MVNSYTENNTHFWAVADPGFPVGGGGGVDSRGGLRFTTFVCRNERIWTRRARPPRSANAERHRFRFSSVGTNSYGVGSFMGNVDPPLYMYSTSSYYWEQIYKSNACCSIVG